MDTPYQSEAELFNSTSADPTANIAGFLVGIVLILALIAVAVLCIVAMWKLFIKAGKPGWASIVPFYNTYVMVELAGRPAWWFAVIILVPLVGTVFSLIVIIDFVKAYGKDTVFGVLSWFFPFVTFPMLAFDKNTHYVGNGATAPGQPVYSQPPAIAPAPTAPSADGPTQPPLVR